MCDRDLKIDGLKAIMIFLVVLGHISNPRYELWTTQIIYAFHMPIFVFLSGYLTNLNVDKEQLTKWCFRMFLLYVFAQEAQNLLSFIMGEGFEIKRILLVDPYFALWYLISLLVWRIVIVIIHDKINDIALLLISCALCVLSGCVPTGIFAVQRTLAFLPFFTLGYLSRKYEYMEKIENICGNLMSMALLVVGLIMSLHLPLYMPNEPYANIHSFFVRLFQTCNALILSFAIIRLSRNSIIEKISIYGRYTLWIYIGHTFLILTQRHFIMKDDVAITVPTGILLALVYCLVCVKVCDAFMYLKNLYACKRRGHDEVG